MHIQCRVYMNLRCFQEDLFFIEIISWEIVNDGGDDDDCWNTNAANNRKL